MRKLWQKILCGCMLSVLFLSVFIGYAQVSDTIYIFGNATSVKQKDVFITEVNGVNANMVGTTVLLQDPIPAEGITFTMTVINENEDYRYYFDHLAAQGLVIDYTVSTLQPYDQIAPENDSGSVGEVKVQSQYTYTIKIVPENGEDLPAGQLLNFVYAKRTAVLAFRSKWFDNSVANGAGMTLNETKKITKIEVIRTSSKVNVDTTAKTISYDGVTHSYTKCWDPTEQAYANKEENNLFAYYRTEGSDVVLRIVGGDEQGNIFVIDPARMFCWSRYEGSDSSNYSTMTTFPNVKSVTGLEHFNTAHINTNNSLMGMFAGMLNVETISGMNVSGMNDPSIGYPTILDYVNHDANDPSTKYGRDWGVSSTWAIFKYCRKMTAENLEAAISNWKCTNVVDTEHMFMGMASLTGTLTLPYFNPDYKVIYQTDYYTGSRYNGDPSHDQEGNAYVKKDAMFAECSNLTVYLPTGMNGKLAAADIGGTNVKVVYNQ